MIALVVGYYIVMKRKQQIKTNINIAYSANSVEVYHAQVVNKNQDFVLKNELYSSTETSSPPADTNRSSMMSNPIYSAAAQINDAAKQGARASSSPPTNTNRSSMMSNPIYLAAAQINDAAKQGAMPSIPEFEVPQ